MTAPRQRLDSIDRLRGLVMVLMTIDHARDFIGQHPFAPTDPENATWALFATRWVTHLCAPVFVYLAGVSAWLKGRGRTPRELSSWLFRRGALLIAIELLVVNPLFMGQIWIWINTYFFVWQVIAAIGTGLIILSLLVRAPSAVAIVFGAACVLGHNLCDALPPTAQSELTLRITRALLRDGNSWIPLGQSYAVGLLYPILPGAGVLALGWASAPWLTEATRPNRRVLAGTTMIVAFVLLRALDGYGDPQHWRDGAGPVVMRFLNLQKYPPSLDYCLVFLGLGALIWRGLDAARGRIGGVLADFGRVPLFFYIAHLAVINVTSLAHAWLFDLPFGYSWLHVWGRLPEHVPTLVPVYIHWLVALAVLWPLCRAWDAHRHRSR